MSAKGNFPAGHGWQATSALSWQLLSADTDATVDG
jgi:hypothetical protein